jgi:hypothetical protein
VGKTFGRSSDIDEKGGIYLQTVAAGKWTPRRREPDVFLDYEVEMRPQGEPNGLTAYVQLKSKDSVVFRHGVSRVQMERKHLEYYLTKALRPVFVVLVDVTSKQGYFVFAQEWLRVTGALKKKPGAKTLSIEISEEDKIDDLPRFETALRRASLYLREMYPGSPEAALAALAREYKAKDPRFDVSVTAGPEGRQIDLSALENVPFSLDITHSNGRKLMAECDNWFGYGKAPDFSGASFDLKGIPLLEEEKIDQVFFNEDARKCTLLVISKAPAFSHALNCKATYGHAGLLVEVMEPGCPVKIVFKQSFKALRERAESDVRLSFDYDRWVGRNLLNLPWFDFLWDLITALNERAPIEFKFNFEGVTFNHGQAAWENRDDEMSYKDHYNMLSFFMKARRVAERGKINPIIPERGKITGRDVYHVEMAFGLLTEGFFKCTKVRKVEAFEINVSEKHLTENDHDTPHNGDIAGHPVDGHVVILGVECPVGMCRSEVKNLPMWIPAEEIEAARKGASHIKMHCKWSYDTVVFIRKVPENGDAGAVNE